MANKSEKANPVFPACGHGVMATAVVGSKGQIVIPKEARKWLSLKPGDQIVLMSKMPGAMIIIKPMASARWQRNF